MVCRKRFKARPCHLVGIPVRDQINILKQMDQLVQGDCQGDNRSWDNKCFFFPIMQDEIEKNNKLIQNPGY
jgi:hypothetical protein